MSGPIRENQLQITRPAGEECRIECLLDIDPDGIPVFLRGHTPSLVMHPSRPADLGWGWPASQETEQRAGHDRPSLIPLHDTGGDQISFSYSLGTIDAVDAFFPPGEATYLVKVQADQEAGIYWFPLPRGRSLHLLDRLLGFEDRTIAYFVEEWLHRRRNQFSLPSIHVLITSDDDHIYDISLPSAADILDDAIEWMESEHLVVPEALLLDPIRNGSPIPWHGFNPWNDDQKARIVAHLERELVRLTDFFQQDAATPSNGTLSCER